MFVISVKKVWFIFNKKKMAFYEKRRMVLAEEREVNQNWEVETVYDGNTPDKFIAFEKFLNGAERTVVIPGWDSFVL